MARILLIENPSVEGSSVKSFLESSFEVVHFSDTKDFLARARKVRADVILLDLCDDGPDSIQICHSVKTDTKLFSSPVIVLANQFSSETMEALFATGADDYLTRPFQLSELKARCLAKMRLVKNVLDKKDLDAGGIQFDIIKRSAIIFDQGEYRAIRLTPSEFQLLVLLCKNPGRILKRDEICQELSKKSPKSPNTRVIDAQISSIRRKSNFFQQSIESIHGVGYRISLEN